MEEKETIAVEEKSKKKNKKEEILEFEIKLKEKEEEVLRAKADLINYRKRKDEEVSRILKYANEDIILKLLLVLDNFERAINMDKELSEEEKNFLEGFKLIYRQTKEILESFEVKEIEALGKIFDSNYHHAVSTLHDETKDNEEILEVYQKGYIYKDKVIRPSMVIINEK